MLGEGKEAERFSPDLPRLVRADLRALVRRDRNRPSVIIWSIGNEVGEQYTCEEGEALARRLCDIVNEEDPLAPRPVR